MPDIIEIVKKRFPEVALIVGFQVGLLLLTDQVTSVMLPAQSQTEASHMGTLPMGMDFILGLGIMICFIVWQLLFWGFLRTAFASGAAQQEPKTLLVIGRAFFWRMFRFQIVFGIAYLMITSFVFSLIISAMYKNVPIADLPAWIAPLVSSIGTIILLKPILLCPAIMIVFGCMVKDSFSKLKNFKPMSDPRLLKLFIAFIVTLFVFSMVETLTKAGSIGHHLILAIQGIITSTLWLMISLYTIAFVAVDIKVDSEIAEGENAENL